MRTLITALALTAILATCAVAKTPRHKEVRVQPNNSKPQRGEAKPHPNQFVLPLRSGETDRSAQCRRRRTERRSASVGAVPPRPRVASGVPSQ